MDLRVHTPRGQEPSDSPLLRLPPRSLSWEDPNPLPLRRSETQCMPCTCPLQFSPYPIHHSAWLLHPYSHLHTFYVLISPWSSVSWLSHHQGLRPCTPIASHSTQSGSHCPRKDPSAWTLRSSQVWSSPGFPPPHPSPHIPHMHAIIILVDASLKILPTSPGSVEGPWPPQGFLGASNSTQQPATVSPARTGQ